MAAIIEMLVWALSVLAIARSRVWSGLVAWQHWSERGTRSHRFWMDWGYVFFAPFLLLAGRWLTLWLRIGLVGVVTVAVTTVRLRSPGTWRFYEPPLR